MSLEIKNPIISKYGESLSLQNLEIFKVKSEFYMPRCFGSYDPKDPVCKDFCFRARAYDLSRASDQLNEQMNEVHFCSLGIFYRDQKFQQSCEHETKVKLEKLEEIKKQIEKELHDQEYQRKKRDDYYLAQNSNGLKRVPVGKIKKIKDFLDFSKPLSLYLETQNKTFFAHPYGPAYDDAVGRIWELISGGAGPEDSERTLGYIKLIKPKLPDAYNYRLKVISQKPNEKGDLTITARINYSKHSSNEYIDIHQVNGKKITIVVFGNSAKESVYVDDLGKI